MRLKWYLPKFAKALKYEPHQSRPNERLEDRLDLLAKLLALYPFTDTDQLAKEFKLTRKTICVLANFYRVFKRDDVRSKICRQNGDNPRSRAAYWLRLNHRPKPTNNNNNNGKD